MGWRMGGESAEDIVEMRSDEIKEVKKREDRSCGGEENWMRRKERRGEEVCHLGPMPMKNARSPLFAAITRARPSSRHFLAICRSSLENFPCVFSTTRRTT